VIASEPVSSNPELFTGADSAEGVLFLDARTGPDAREAFARERLAGARWIDLETQLSHKGDPAHGGRHPLPSTAAFVATLASLGVTRESDVVVYDAQRGANAAARAWWMLRAIGHPRVRVMDGGMPAALARGLPTESGPEAERARAEYALPDAFARALEEGTREHPLADLAAVRRAVTTGERVVLDVREADRFRGEREPIDPIAGHIPGAINVPLAENLDARGRFRGAEELRRMYAGLLSGDGASAEGASAEGASAEGASAEGASAEGASARGLIVHCGSQSSSYAFGKLWDHSRGWIPPDTLGRLSRRRTMFATIRGRPTGSVGLINDARSLTVLYSTDVSASGQFADIDFELTFDAGSCRSWTVPSQRPHSI
jgi:thiosulfate/3-mercaptopyruvate sulfurtransferase